MRLEKIVIGIDFGQQSLQAARWVREQLAPEAELVLVHSVHVPTAPRFMRGGYPDQDEVRRTLEVGATERLAEFRKSLGETRVRMEIAAGKPSQQLCRVAESEDADLVVVGEHGPRRGIWSVMGSTAENCLGACDRTVLLARNLPEARLERLLVAVDEDDNCPTALAWARFLRQRFDSSVTVLHVLRDLLYRSMERACGVEEARHLRATMEADASRWLAQETEAAGFGEGEMDVQITSGDPDYAIPVASQHMETDLIIMGRHGRSGVSGAVLGSAARSVMQYATCSVLVLQRPARSPEERGDEGAADSG